MKNNVRRTVTVLTAILALLAGLVTAQAPFALADPPTGTASNVTVTSGNASASVSFGNFAGDSTIVGWQYSFDAGATWQTLDVDDPAGIFPAATITGLANGVTYNIIIRGVNADGEGGPPSDPATFTPGLPAMPSLNVVNGDRRATITFPIPDGNGSPITSYQMSTDGVDYTPLRVTPKDGQVSISVSGLTNGQTYTYYIRAGNRYGYGPPGSANLQPDVAPKAPTGVSATAGDGIAEVSFVPTPSNNGGSDVAYYTVSSLDGSASGYCGATDPCFESHVIEVSGLTNGTAYQFTVTANNTMPSVPSDPSNEVIPFGSPLAPQLTVTGVNYRSANLSFTPAGENGRAVTNYQYSVNGGKTWLNYGNHRSGPVPLAANTRYQIAVRGVRSDANEPVRNIGASSNVVSILTNPAALQTPSVRTGTGWAVVSWRRSPNDSLTLGYTVYAHPGPATCSTNYRADTACIIGAKAGMRYTYSVVARNATGGAPQSRGSGVVKAASPHVPKHAPGVPHALSTGKVTKVKRGGKLVVAGSGFLAYSSVYVATYGKKGHVAAKLVANYRGQFKTTIRVPKDKIKRYTIVAYGVTQYGSSKAISKTVRRK